VALLPGVDLSATGMVAIYVVVTAITVGVGSLLLNRAWPDEAQQATPEYRVKSWVRSALPMMFMGGMQIINNRTDILMLGAMKGAAAVGVYVVVNRCTQPITFMLGAVNSVMAPNIASLHAEGKSKQLQRVVTKITRLIALISITCATILIIFGELVLSLFGSDFTQGRTALVILSMGQVINGATGSGGLLLTMTGYEHYAAMIVATSALLNVIGNAILIPVWGIEGAAIATASSTIIVNILRVIWVRKKIGIDSTFLGKLI